MKTNSSLQALFEPKSIAVIGASSKKGKTSYFLMKNLLHGGYPGKVYPVNPNAAKIFTYKSYKSVLDIPDEIDLAFLVVTNDAVEQVLLDCARKNVKAVMIVTAGFGEVGEAGAELQRRVAEILRNNECAVWGRIRWEWSMPHRNYWAVLFPSPDGRKDPSPWLPRAGSLPEP